MGHIFRPGLHACDVVGTLVFLDVAADRYFALTDPAGEACLRLIAGYQGLPGDAAIIDALVARDILRHADGASRPLLCDPAPIVVTSLFDTAARARPRLVIAALARHAFAVGELKMRPLARILNGIARAKLHSSAARTRQGDPTELAAAFAAADRLMTAYGRCLARSVALARAMIGRGVEPLFIIGVKLRPFEAHCWVQHGDRLVSDDPGTIAPFTPILVL